MGWSVVRAAVLTALAIGYANAAAILETYGSVTYSGYPVYSTTTNGATVTLPGIPESPNATGSAVATATYGTLDLELRTRNTNQTNSALQLSTASGSARFSDSLTFTDPEVVTVSVQYDSIVSRCCAANFFYDLNVEFGTVTEEWYNYGSTLTTAVVTNTPVNLSAYGAMGAASLNQRGETFNNARYQWSIRQFTAYGIGGIALENANYTTASGVPYTFINGTFAGQSVAETPEPGTFVLMSLSCALLLGARSLRSRLHRS